MNFLYKFPGYVLLLFGAFCLSWGGFIVRSFEDSSVWQILLIRSFFFIIALTLFLISTYKKNTIKIFRDAGYPALIGGLVMSLSFVAYVYSMMITSVANVVFIISTQTLFLAVFGYFFLKEKISIKGFIAISLAMFGIIIMVGESFLSGSFIGNIVALVIPINFSVLVMIIRKYPHLDMVPAIFYSGVLSCVYGFFLAESLFISPKDLYLSILLGVPQLAFGFIFVTIGSRTTPAVTVGLLMLLETIFAPIWVWLIYNEIPPVSVIIGGAIVMSAVIIKSFENKSFKVSN